jgi:predicted RNA-binding protein with TRAM domain
MPTFVFDGGGRAGAARKEREERPYLLEKPVKQGEEYDVTIEDVGARGDGFARVQNFVVFVPGTSKGEQCRIRVNSVHPKFALGERVGGPAPENSTTTATL